MSDTIKSCNPTQHRVYTSAAARDVQKWNATHVMARIGTRCRVDLNDSGIGEPVECSEPMPCADHPAEEAKERAERLLADQGSWRSEVLAERQRRIDAAEGALREAREALAACLEYMRRDLADDGLHHKLCGARAGSTAYKPPGRGRGCTAACDYLRKALRLAGAFVTARAT